MWITNGAVNDFDLGDAFLVSARTGAGRFVSSALLSVLRHVPVAHRAASNGAGATFRSFLVDKGMAGFSLGSRIKRKLGMRASGTAELVYVTPWLLVAVLL